MAENQFLNNAFSFCLYVTCIRSSHFNDKTEIHVCVQFAMVFIKSLFFISWLIV